LVVLLVSPAPASDDEKSVLEFNANLIFFVILPPIILDAGYTLKRKDFFQNLGTILSLAIFGTVINNIVFGYLLYGFAKLEWIPLDNTSPLECLLFGAVISATDPVATLAMLGSKEVNAHPLLYSLVFGESVLNDAVAVRFFVQEKRMSLLSLLSLILCPLLACSFSDRALQDLRERPPKRVRRSERAEPGRAVRREGFAHRARDILGRLDRECDHRSERRARMLLHL
jgi:hypothetical protein